MTFEMKRPDIYAHVPPFGKTPEKVYDGPVQKPVNKGDTRVGLETVPVLQVYLPGGWYTLKQLKEAQTALFMKEAEELSKKGMNNGKTF